MSERYKRSWKWASHYFQCVIFRCKWWNTYNQNNVKEDHDSRLICTNSRKMWDATKEPYVFPKHSNQEFFYLDLLDRDWWFVLRHSPKSKHIFANNNVIMPSEEYNLGDGSREWYVHVLFLTFLLWMCHFIMVIYKFLIMFSYSCYDVGYEKWIIIYSYHVENNKKCFGRPYVLLVMGSYFFLGFEENKRIPRGG